MKNAMAALTVIAAALAMIACGAKKEETNPFGHLQNKQQAREALGKPGESNPAADLPPGAVAELERLGLLKNAKSFDRFVQFRQVTSLPAAPGIYYIYIVYDDSGSVVYTFKRLVD